MIEAVASGYVDPSIRSLYNRISLALDYGWLPSAIEQEANKDVEAAIIISNTRAEVSKTKNNSNQIDGGI